MTAGIGSSPELDKRKKMGGMDKWMDGKKPFSTEY